MSGRHQPLAGADSEITYSHYRVLVEEEIGGRLWIDIPAAMGQHDASHQAEEKARDLGYFDVTTIKAEAVPA